MLKPPLNQLTHPLLNNPPTPPHCTAGGTGLSFSVDGPTVRDAIRALKARNPNTRVMLAVGGATYTNFAGEARVQARA